MKYLIMEDFSGQAIAFLFPRRVDHEDMREQLPYAKVISAGYLELDAGQFKCSGGYPALGLNAREEDLAIIIEALRKR